MMFIWSRSLQAQAITKRVSFQRGDGKEAVRGRRDEPLDRSSGHGHTSLEREDGLAVGSGLVGDLQASVQESVSSPRKGQDASRDSLC